MANTLSGPSWVSRFPTGTTTQSLTPAFAAAVNLFVAALRQGGASVTISATLRPPERAFLMHYSYKVARSGLDPANVPAMAGVAIDWVHRDAKAKVNLTASRAAASQMVSGYGIVYAPALVSRHSQGRAIDMNVTNYLNKKFVDGKAVTTTVKSAAELHALGATFGVIKLVNDPPHWSDDGH